MSKELSAQELFEQAEKEVFVYNGYQKMKQAWQKREQEIEKAIDDRINKICTLYIRNSSCKECKREIEELCPAKPFIELKQTILSKGVVK
jgi:hypothetical protein